MKSKVQNSSNAVKPAKGQKEETSNKITEKVKVGLLTPKIKIKFSSVITPFFYPNAPQVPRFSVTCIVDISDKEQAEFLKMIQDVEKEFGIIETVFKSDVGNDEEGDVVKTGNATIKFQTRVPISVSVPNGEDWEIADLENEIAPGSIVSIQYDIVKYRKRGYSGSGNGLSFQPKRVFLYSQPEVKEMRKMTRRKF